MTAEALQEHIKKFVEVLKSTGYTESQSLYITNEIVKTAVETVYFRGANK